MRDDIRDVFVGITVLTEWWTQTSHGMEHRSTSRNYENENDARTDMMRDVALDRMCHRTSRYTLRMHYERPSRVCRDLVLSSGRPPLDEPIITGAERLV